jgi:hypothetical protein
MRFLAVHNAEPGAVVILDGGWADAANQADVHGVVLVVLLPQHSAQAIGTLKNPPAQSVLTGRVHS